MLFFTPRPGHKLNWKVQNVAEGTEDLVPVVVTEAPSGGARSTVRVIAQRTSRDGKQSYKTALSVPERFLELREEIVEELDGPADSPFTLAEIMEHTLADAKAYAESRQAAATIAS